VILKERPMTRKRHFRTEAAIGVAEEACGPIHAPLDDMERDAGHL